MRVKIFACIALLLLAPASPSLLKAQFQQPTEEELKMTADPQAPGAAAVYLYREETTNDLLHFHSYYVRIKVLTEKGRELATVHIPYEHGKFQVAAIQGRTIHPDGTVIPLAAKPSDLLEYKDATHQYNQMVFNLPDATVGSILEYRLQLRYSDEALSSPEWDIQQPYFVHKAHYSFLPMHDDSHQVVDEHGQVSGGLLYMARLGLGEDLTHDTQNRFSLDLNDIPALPDEDWMPPLNTIGEKVVFYYTDTASAEEYWSKEGKYWERDVNHFANPSGLLKKAITEIVSPTDTEEEKARKIYTAVLKLKNTSFVEADIGPGGEKVKARKDAGDVWKQQSGSSDDLALLYVALARAAGLKAWPMQVVNRDRALFEKNYFSVHQLDDFLAIVEISGQNIYLDPGQPMCSFGELHWKHQLASGFRLTEKGAVIETTSSAAPEATTIRRTAELAIDERGGLAGTAHISMTGQVALNWRQIALESGVGELKKQFEESVRDSVPEGIQIDLDHFEALDNPEAELAAVVKISGSLGTMTTKRSILPGVFFETRSNHPFVEQATRSTPVDLHYSAIEQDDVTYHLPKGFSLESAPLSTNVSWTDYAALHIVSTAKDDALHVTRTFDRGFSVLSPGGYRNLRDFYRQVAFADQQQLVLKKPVQAGGN